MSYMNTHAAFAPAGGIQELSFDEIDCIAGGRSIVVKAIKKGLEWVGNALTAVEIADAMDAVSDNARENAANRAPRTPQGQASAYWQGKYPYAPD